MTNEDKTEILAGDHWLNRLAQELGLDAGEEIDALEAWEWEPGEIALSLLDLSAPNGIVRASMVRVRCWPFEKSRILNAARGSKLEDFVRQAMIEKAMKEPNASLSHGDGSATPTPQKP